MAIKTIRETIEEELEKARVRGFSMGDEKIYRVTVDGLELAMLRIFEEKWSKNE